jgi:hypothetical protein
MTPEQIAIGTQRSESGCPSCQWYGWKNNTTGGARICDALQPAFPNGDKTICKPWYRLKSVNKGNGRGRIDQKSR